MAEFSKEYIDKHNQGAQYDFSIVAAYNELKSGHYVNFICEGYGFAAILRIERSDTEVKDVCDMEDCRLVYTDYNDQDAEPIFVRFDELEEYWNENIKLK